MAFTDLNFLSRFLPLFIIIYFFAPKKYQTAVLFVGSMIFYTMGDYKFLIVLLLLCGINFLFSIVNWGSRIKKKENRYRTLMCIIAIDAGTLILFKLLNIVFGLVLPLGISFYVFKMISYQVDIYRGDIEKPASILTVATYFTLFFQIAQGPIMRFNREDFKKEGHKMSLVAFEEGLKYLIIGLAMKVLLADRLEVLWNEAVKNGFDSLSTPMAWLSAIGYSMELYFDFWGYSLMAAGIGIMLGFNFVENFRHPYSAASVGEFYRRWHITLTSWFKDYVYIPLGGNRNGTKDTIFNIIIVWLLTGFWHGGGIHFILWGLVLAALIISEKYLLNDIFKKYPILGHIHVIFWMPITWAIFAIDKMEDVCTMLLKMIPITGNVSGLNPGDFAHYLGQFYPYLIVAIILCIPRVFEIITAKYEDDIRYVQAGALLVLLWVSMYFSYTSTSNPFLYFYF